MAVPVHVIETGRLRLDALTGADVPVIAREWGDPRVARMTATVKPDWTEAEARDWLSTRGARGDRDLGLAIRRREDLRLIGTVGIGGDPVNLGYMLGPGHWGRGYGTEAVRAFLRAAYGWFEDLDAIEAGVFDDNPASARVLIKCGFIRIGAGECHSLARVEPAANSAYRLTRHAFGALT